MMLICKIGDAIKKSGYTREYIANEVEVSIQQISNWVVGRSRPTTEKLYKLAYVLKCKVDDLYEWKEE